jgi:hypothetical protein
MTGKESELDARAIYALYAPDELGCHGVCKGTALGSSTPRATVYARGRYARR